MTPQQRTKWRDLQTYLNSIADTIGDLLDADTRNWPADVDAANHIISDFICPDTGNLIFNCPALPEVAPIKNIFPLGAITEAHRANENF